MKIRAALVAAGVASSLAGTAAFAEAAGAAARTASAPHTVETGARRPTDPHPPADEGIGPFTPANVCLALAAAGALVLLARRRGMD